MELDENNQNNNAEVEISFFTRLKEDKYSVPRGTFIVLSEITRAGLSELLNQLLDLESHVIFDFLVDGIFLRGSLADYLISCGKTSESILKVEYILAIGKPNTILIDENNDWIRRVINGLNTDYPVVITSSYDGIVRFYKSNNFNLLNTKNKNLKLDIKDQENCPIMEFDTKDTCGHCTTVLSMATYPSNDSDYSKLWFSTMDGGIIGIDYLLGSDHEKNDFKVRFYQPEACNGPIEALSPITSEGSLVVCGSQSGDMHLLSSTDLTHKNSEQIDTYLQLEELFELKVHKSSISEIVSVGDYVISSSLDGTLKIVQIPRGVIISGWDTKASVTSLSIKNNHSCDIICTSHDDGKVRIWDLRAGATSQLDINNSSNKSMASIDNNTRLIQRSAINAHRRLISQLKWNPLSDYMLGSVSHDFNLKILDIRSPLVPLQSVDTNEKLLTLSWSDSKTIYTGGSSGKLLMHSFYTI
ncbi:hypothetical protein cand_027620 [Cryptosporidium andersoni]|uniref:NLE domain-containing protein n=1 Tax=Cryptosporidium andersoni TaxID=117008 RepID=A0A1J4MV24_9CRYT|nr:hypothetical protein cand_027620 [Cryptosporidium andersoni]